MEAFENLQFQSEVYFKLKEAERVRKNGGKTYSSEETLRILKDSI